MLFIFFKLWIFREYSILVSLWMTSSNIWNSVPTSIYFFVVRHCSYFTQLYKSWNSIFITQLVLEYLFTRILGLVECPLFINKNSSEVITLGIYSWCYLSDFVSVVVFCQISGGAWSNLKVTFFKDQSVAKMVEPRKNILHSRLARYAEKG